MAPLTALAGPNGSGKSSLLRALDLVLGQRWPGLHRLSIPHDFTGCEDDRSLFIGVRLEEPFIHTDALGKPHPIHGYRVSCKPYARRTRKSLPGDPNFDYDPVGLSAPLIRRSGPKLSGARWLSWPRLLLPARSGYPAGALVATD